MRAAILLGIVGVLAAPLGAQTAPAPSASTQNLPVSLNASKITPLRGILRIAAEYRIPVGIVVGTHPLLCGSRKDFNIREAGVWDVFEEVVARTGYEVTFEDGVFVIRAPDTTAHELELLDHQFERFRATKDTISGAGGWLAGYILTVEGASGFGGDNLFSPGEPTFTIDMQSVTTEQIANRIVTSGGKGVWVFRPTPEGSTTTIAVRAFAYGWEKSDLDHADCEGAFAAVK
jgi:hypothetical protein